jgi:hypothetical protein
MDKASLVAERILKLENNLPEFIKAYCQLQEECVCVFQRGTDKEN